MAHWVANAWVNVTTETISDSFNCTGITGSTAQLHGKLKALVEESSMGIEVSDDDEGELIIDEDAGLIETDDNPTTVIEIGEFN